MISIDVLLSNGEEVLAAVKRTDQDVAQAVDAAKTLCPDWIRMIVFLEQVPGK